MTITENTKYIIATLGILLLGAALGVHLYGDQLLNRFLPQSKEVHVHANFSFYILNNRVDLTAEKYQSSPESIKHPSMHFHDGVDTVLHRHAEGITLGEFMKSLGITLTSSCVTLDTQEEYCTDAHNVLRLYVNGTVVQDPASYVTQEKDRLLLYYGAPGDPIISELLMGVTDDACMYSGTCPERGNPPFESCGLTCEI